MTKDSVKVPPLKDQKMPDAPVADNPAEANAAETETKAADVEKPKAVPKKTIKVLHVVAKREGFRRAGFAFGSERTRLVADELTAEQIKQLKEEPMLVVTEATEEV